MMGVVFPRCKHHNGSPVVKNIWNLELGANELVLKKKTIYPKLKKISQKVVICFFNFFLQEVITFWSQIFIQKIFPLNICEQKVIKFISNKKNKKWKQNLKSKIRRGRSKTPGVWNISSNVYIVLKYALLFTFYFPWSWNTKREILCFITIQKVEPLDMALCVFLLWRNLNYYVETIIFGLLCAREYE